MPEVVAFAALAVVVGAVGVGLGILLAPRVARLAPLEDLDGDDPEAGGTGDGDP